MDKVFDKLMQVIARTLSLKEFELWLYTDEFVNSQASSDDIIIDLLSVNFNLKNSISSLEKIALSSFKKEEVLISVIQHNFGKLIEENIENSLNTCFYNISCFDDFQEEYELLSDIRVLSYEWEYAENGIYSKEETLNDLIPIAQKIFEELSSRTHIEKIELLKNGLENGTNNHENSGRSQFIPTISYTKIKSRKWYQFWK